MLKMNTVLKDDFSRLLIKCLKKKSHPAVLRQGQSLRMAVAMLPHTRELSHSVHREGKSPLGFPGSVPLHQQLEGHLRGGYLEASGSHM